MSNAFLVTAVCYAVGIVTALADQLPAPFTSYETESTSGGNGTTYSWALDSNTISGDIYAGQVQSSRLQSTARFSFISVAGTLKFKCVNYGGGLGCNDPYWFCSWLTDGVLIDNWTGQLDGASYKENFIECHFAESGEHTVVFSLAMNKHASKYYVQGPSMSISQIQWCPNYVDTVADGKAIRIDGEWIRQNVAPSVIADFKYDYSSVLNSVGDNGYRILDSYIAGLTPTNSTSRLITRIHVGNDSAVITWTPNLESRNYTIYGKTNLTDKAWHSPTNEASRFFKVEVEMR